MVLSARNHPRLSLSLACSLLLATLALLALTAQPAAAGDSVRTAASGDELSSFVIGGQPVTDDALFPYLTAVLSGPDAERDFYCGGTLVAPRWVLTAAHCENEDLQYFPSFVAIGSADRTSRTQQVIPVTAYFPHGGFNVKSLHDDIMLLHLAWAPVGIPLVTPAAPGDDPPDNSLLRVVGWGLTVENAGPDDSPPAVANVGTLENVAQATCRSKWRKYASISDSQICAAHPAKPPHSACSGDSGGPLLYGSRQVGVVSFGMADCTNRLPGIFTRVSSYRHWIFGTIDKVLSPQVRTVRFGRAMVKDRAVSRVITLTSGGESAATPVKLEATGDFSVAASTCAAALAPGQSCQATVSFRPTKGGIRGGSLLVHTDSGSGDPARVSLVGLGLGKSSRPVNLRVARASGSRAGGGVRVTYRVTYRVPKGVIASTACKGRVTGSMRAAGYKRSKRAAVKHVQQRLGRQPACVARITLRFPGAAAGASAKLKVSFAGNKVLVASKRTFKLKLR